MQKITQYYQDLINNSGYKNQLGKMVEYSSCEENFFEEDDPLHEERNQPFPFLIHKHPNRVVVLCTNQCPVYCSFCSRRRNWGKKREIDLSNMEELRGYLAQHQEINEVILSGGEPLLLGEKLIKIIELIAECSQVEVIRIGTRLPAVDPQGINLGLVTKLAKFKKIWLMVHFEHFAELTEEAIACLSMFQKAAIPIFNQSVILKGVNDDVTTLGCLFRGLVKCRVKPYYLYLVDQVKGTEKFRIDKEEALRIFEELTQRLSGLALPVLVEDSKSGKKRMG